MDDVFSDQLLHDIQYYLVTYLSRMNIHYSYNLEEDSTISIEKFFNVKHFLPFLLIDKYINFAHIIEKINQRHASYYYFSIIFQQDSNYSVAKPIIRHNFSLENIAIYHELLFSIIYYILDNIKFKFLFKNDSYHLILEPIIDYQLFITNTSMVVENENAK